MSVEAWWDGVPEDPREGPGAEFSSVPDEAVPDEAVDDDSTWRAPVVDLHPDDPGPATPVDDEAGEHGVGGDAGGAAGTGGWAVPGVGDGPGSDGEELSPAASHALEEVASAWEALRLAQARCYRALIELDASGAVSETGYRSQARLVEDHVRADAREARSWWRQADSVTATVSPTGRPVPPELPATAEQVEAGVIGPGHVEVVRTTMGRLACVDDVDAATLATTEAELAQLATTRSPSALAEAAAAILALLDPDGTAPRDEPAPENELHLTRRRRTGELAGKFVFRDPAAAELLTGALAAATPPAESEPFVGEDGRGPDGPGGIRGEAPEAVAARTLPERRAQALLDLAAEAMTRGLDVDDADSATRAATEPAPADAAPAEPATAGSGPAGPAPERSGPAGPEPEESATEGAGREAAAPGELVGQRSAAVDGVTPGPSVHGEPTEDTAPGDDCLFADPVSTGTGGPPSSPAPRWRRPEIEGGERVALTVTMDLRTLMRAWESDPPPPEDAGRRGGRQRLALVGESGWVRAETARRLACDAELVPAVLGSRSEVLDVGRRMRLVPVAIRRAVVLRDRHCAHPGCRRRARRCQVHHVIHWADGGETSLENGVLLCAYHHTLVHQGGWEIRMIDGLPWFVPPRWLDPERRPRHNRPWQIVAA